jgi:hypothetical protein
MHVLSGWVARGVVVYVLQNALLLGYSFLKLIDGAHNIRFGRCSVVWVLVEGVPVQRVVVDQPSRGNLQATEASFTWTQALIYGNDTHPVSTSSPRVHRKPN